MQVHAHNLANLQTTGFKADMLLFTQATPPGNTAPELASSHHVDTPLSVADWGQGGIMPSSNPLHVAIDGAGFFALLTPHGERLTRSGNLTMDTDGILRSDTQHPLEGLAGAVVVPLGTQVSVDKEGVVFANGTPVDRLKVVDVPDRGLLRREASGLWNAEAASPFVIEPTLQPNALEASNVGAASVMTQMVACQRAFESYHRCIETIHGSEKRLIEHIR